MAQTIKTSIQIDADIKSFEQGLSSIEAKLGQLKLPAGLSRQFSTEISSIKDQLTKLGDFTANNELSIIDVRKAERALEIIQQQYTRLVKSLQDEKMGDIVSREDAAHLAALTKAAEAYKVKMADAIKIEERLSKELDKARAAQEEFNRQKEKQKVLDEADYAILKNQVSEQRKKEKDLLKQIADAERAKQARIESSGGKYTSENSKGFKQTAEYKEWIRLVEQLNLEKQRTIQLETELGRSTTASRRAVEEKRVTDAVQSAEQALKTYQSTALQTSKIEALTAAKKELENIDGINLDAIQSFDDLKAVLEQVQAAAENNASSIKNMSSDMSTCEQAADNLSDKVGDASDQLKAQNETAKKTEGFVDRIKQFTGLTGAMMIFRKAAQSAFNAIKELDAQMTEMAVVTNQSVGDYWSQMPEHTKRANELGVAIKDVYEAETLYYQQGLKTNEVVEVSTSTLKMARIAGMDAAEATDKMTAALRGFNLAVNGTNADRVADVYSKLAAITASTVDEISTAMTKTASIAANAGMELETTAAFLSQIIETTRESAETAGTAMKTVVARFQELKKDPSEIGEVDGEVIDANKIETALKTVGVSIRDVSGQFRDLDDVFMELAQKWDSLDTNTQRYIATIAAGSRQQSRFIAMMSNYSRTTELVEAANNSAGTSNQQFEKTLESLDVYLNRLKNAWDEFTTGLMNSDFVKFVVEALTTIINGLNGITSSSNSAFNSLLKIGLIVGVVFTAKAAIDAFSVGVKNAGKDVGVLSAGTSGIFEALKGKIDQVGLKLKYVFDKKYRLEVDAKKAAQAQKTAKELVMTEKKLIKNEQQLAVITKKRASGQQLTKKEQQQENKLQRENNNLKKQQAGLTSTLNSLGAVGIKTKAAEIAALAAKVPQEAAENAAEAAGIPIENARILLAKGYTKEQIKEMGAKKANMIATVTKNGLTVTETTTTLGLWLATKLSTLAEKLQTKGKIGAIIATKLQTIANWALQASMGAILLVIILIIAAIALLVIGILAIVKAIKKHNQNSPENRLKRAKKTLEDTTEAANNAADAYSSLTDNIKSLKEGYDTVDSMTRGTKEWQEEVDKVNDQVMDLIAKYPELADQVETVNGVMRISEEALEQIQQKAAALAASTRTTQMAASVEVARTDIDVKKEKAKETFQDNTAGYQKGWNNDHEADLQALAEALYNPTNTVDAALKDGATAEEIKKFMYDRGVEISDSWAEGLAKSQDKLKEWGESLQTLSDAQKVLARSIAEEVKADMTEEDRAKFGTGIDQMTGMSTKGQKAHVEKFKSAYNNTKGNNNKNKKDAVEEYLKPYGGKSKYLEWAKETYGNDVIINDYGEVFRGKEKSANEISSANDNLTLFLESRGSFYDTKKATEKYKELVETKSKKSVAANEALNRLSNKASLSQADLDAIDINLTRGRLKGLMAKEEAGTLTAEDMAELALYREKEAGEIALKTNLDKLTEYGLSTPEGKLQHISGEVASGFVESMKKAKIPAEDAQGLWNTFSTSLNDADISNADRDEIAKSFFAIDKSDQFAIDQWVDTMQKTYRGANIDWNAFADGATSAGKALYRLSEDGLRTFANDIDSLLTSLRNGSQGTNLSAEQWEQASKSMTAEMKDRFVQLNDGTYQFLGSVTEMADGIEAQAKRIFNDQYEVVKQDREAAIKTAKEANTELTEERKKEFERRIENAALSYGQTLSDADLAKEIIKAQNQIGVLSGQDKEDKEAEYKGLITARMATAAANGVDSRLINSLQQAYDNNDNEAVRRLLNQINEVLLEKNSPFSSVKVSAEKLTRAQDALTTTQEKYNDLISSSSTTVAELTTNMKLQEEQLQNVIKLSQESINAQEAMLAKREEELENQYSKYGKDIFVYDDTSGDYHLNYAYEDQIERSEDAEAIFKSLEELNESRKNISETAKNKSDKEKELKELKNTYREAMSSALEKVVNILEQDQQSRIDELSKLNDTITNLQESILEGMREQIELQRQTKENQEKQQATADKETRLAYLLADSSGNNTQEILALQEEIQKDRESYVDELIDQQLDEIENANEKAENQRQKQIDLLTEQLERDRDRDLRTQAYQMLMSGDLKDFNTFLQSDLVKAFKSTTDYLKLSTIEKDAELEELYTTLLKGASGIGVLGLPHYATGGLVTSTGPAWLDGTPSDPELVLNSQDAKNFLMLKDVLSELVSAHISNYNETDSKNSSTSYVDIDINVESLSSDYDVDNIANRIQEYLAENALYRNTTMVSNRR